MANETCKICKTGLLLRGKSKRPGETLWICANGHKWQSRGVGLYRSNWKREDSKRLTAVRVYPDDLLSLRRRGLSVQRVLDDAIRKVLATGE